MMMAAGPYSLPFMHRGDGGRLAGRPWFGGQRTVRAAGSHLLQLSQDDDLRRLQRGAAQHRLVPRSWGAEHGFRIHRGPGQSLRDAVARWVEKGFSFRAPPRAGQGRWFRVARGVCASWPSWASPAWPSATRIGGMAFGAVEAMVVMEELGRGLVNAPYAAGVAGGADSFCRTAPAELQAAWLPKHGRRGDALVVLAHQERKPRATGSNQVATQAVEARARAAGPLSGAQERGAGRPTRPMRSSCRRIRIAVASACSWSTREADGQQRARAIATQDGARAAEVALLQQAPASTDHRRRPGHALERGSRCGASPPPAPRAWA